MLFRIEDRRKTLVERFLLLVWMTYVVSLFSVDIVYSSHSEETSTLRSRKSNTKRNYQNARSSLAVHSDFPYRYVFPANHPFSSFAQFLSPPPIVTGYHDQNDYETYTSPSPAIVTAAGRHPTYIPATPPEYKITLKSPQSSPYQPNVSPFQNVNPPFHLTPIPIQPGATSTVLLVHTGGPAGSVRTFLLVPAERSTLTNAAMSYSQTPATVPPLHLLSQYGYGGGWPNLMSPHMTLQSANIGPHAMHSALPQMLLRPSNSGGSVYSKPSLSGATNHFHSLLQHPITVFQLPNTVAAKYYPQKKNAIESKMSVLGGDAIESSRESTSTSTEEPSVNIHRHTSKGSGKRKSSSKPDSNVSRSENVLEERN